jgi:cytochrome b involved in lipid metabolism
MGNIESKAIKTDTSTGIVVDHIIYDCTNFLKDHPGGEHVIKSFGGAECSWQFWRFHGRKEMEEDGKPLRIGRTEGLKNKYPEPMRYVGLRSRGDDEW